MDAFHDFITNDFGLSAINAAALWIIFVLVRQRYTGLVKDNENATKRIARLEKTLWVNGFKLGELEEMDL